MGFNVTLQEDMLVTCQYTNFMCRVKVIYQLSSSYKNILHSCAMLIFSSS